MVVSGKLEGPPAGQPPRRDDDADDRGHRRAHALGAHRVAVQDDRRLRQGRARASRASSPSAAPARTTRTTSSRYLFEQAAKIKLKYVPFNSGGEVTAALMGGHIDAGIMNPNEIVAQVEARKAKNLAVAARKRTAPTRPTCRPSPRRATSSTGSRCAASSGPAGHGARGGEVVAGHAEEGDRDARSGRRSTSSATCSRRPRGPARRPTSTSTASTAKYEKALGALGALKK